MQGVRVPISTRRFRHSGFARVRIEKTTPHPGMYMKTKNTVRRPRSEVRSRKASATGAPVPTPGSLLLTPTLQEVKVQPEMLLKTKESLRSPRSEARSRKALTAGALVPTPGSLLLTPALQQMKVHPEMLLKTKESVRSPRPEGRSRKASAARANVLGIAGRAGLPLADSSARAVPDPRAAALNRPLTRPDGARSDSPLRRG